MSRKGRAGSTPASASYCWRVSSKLDTRRPKRIPGTFLGDNPIQYPGAPKVGPVAAGAPNVGPVAAGAVMVGIDGNGDVPIGGQLEVGGHVATGAGHTGAGGTYTGSFFLQRQQPAWPTAIAVIASVA
jgi:hypothetical protein